MVKVGDKIRILENNAFGTDAKKGDIFLVGEVDKVGRVEVCGPYSFTFYPEHYELVIENPTYTIPADTETVTLKYADGSTQDIDVKDRARGVPEWVKDGAWVVHKDSGKAYKLVKGVLAWYVQDEKENIFAHHIWDIDIVHQYRPFTHSDWKWGMWAEYRGEKVFVCEDSVVGVYASKKTDAYCFISHEELTPTTAP